MQKTDHSENGENPESKEHSQLSKRARLFLLLGLLALVGILTISYIVNRNPSEGFKLLSQNALNLLIFIAICFQVYIYRKQANMMRQSLDIMGQQRQAMTQQLNAMMYGQRAYLAVVSFEFRKGQFDTMGMRKYNLIIENSSNTPASDVQIFQIGEARECSPSPAVSPTEWIHLGILAPRQRAIYLVDLTGQGHMIGTTPSNGSHYHCQGVVRYGDIFGNTQCTYFCMELAESPYLSGAPCKAGGNYTCEQKAN